MASSTTRTSSSSSYITSSYNNPVTTTTSRHQHVTIRVLAAETGATYKISLPLTELTVANLRSHLAAAVPPSDQILLLGPPYKVPKDPIFQSDEILNSLRLGDVEDDPIHEGDEVDEHHHQDPPLSPLSPTSGEQQAQIIGTTTSIPTASAAGEAAATSNTTSTAPTTEAPRPLLKLPRRRLLGQSSLLPTSIQQQQQHVHRTGAASTISGVGVARRLFLFSKSALSSATPIDAGPPCRLLPDSITLPTDVSGPSPLADAIASSSHASSPLHQALVAYESQFRKYLEQGRVLADAADMRLNSCVSCLQEQAVMVRALQAAVSNLNDHSLNAQKTRTEFTILFHSKTNAHAQLLQGFESLLQQLSTISLHPALVQAAARATTHASSTHGTTMMTATTSTTIPGTGYMTTLLDTVPVERERNWMQQCQTSHNRLVALFQELESDFVQWSVLNANGNEQDEQAIVQLEQKWEQVQGTGKALQKQQAQRLDQLTASHSQVVTTILHAIRANRESALQAAFGPLGEWSESSKGLVPSMLQADHDLHMMQQSVADGKTNATLRLKQRLREISAAQSGIQKALSNLSVLKDALRQQCENMEHIEHVAELPAAYQQFLQELQRRRAYGQAVLASSNALLERLAALRDDEIKAREKFLRGPGRHLMPAFYEVFVPSLSSPPPLFAPQLPLNEMDTLPDVGTSIVTSATLNAPRAGGVGVGGGFSSMQVAEHGVSSASSLTTSGQQVGGSSNNPDHEMSSGAVVAAGGGGGDGTGQQQQLQQQQDQLIVSASEQSGNDLYMDPASGAAAEAEARTLAYENIVLRQALERLGGKPPRTYIQESRGAVSAATSGAAVAAAAAREEKAQAEVLALRKELAESKARADSATEALKAAATSSALEKSGLSDKISHSSFQVGDVGLFMPTGRGSGGKRTYLAFHTKCPYRFLSTDNIKGTPDFVLGRIVYQEELVAGELGTDANPYGLPVGTKFWVLTVEVLTSQT